MENNILLLLPISTNVNESKSKLKQNKRKQQYIEGIKRVLEYPKIKQFDVVLIDNTTTKKDSDLEEIMPKISEYIAIDKNENGQKNIGAGILDVWEYLKDDIKTYDWIIHYEPRQYMKDFRIFDMFLEAPKNIFLYGDRKKNHYYTGLFTLNTKELLQYIARVNAQALVRKRIGLEYSMFMFIRNVEIVDEMGIRWHDRAKDRYVDL
jgi:hypothetical protein